MTTPTYPCDWPVDGRACGRPGRWYLEIEGVHRPFCNGCVSLASKVDSRLEFQSIEHINPEWVRQKPPTQRDRDVERQAEIDAAVNRPAPATEPHVREYDRVVGYPFKWREGWNETEEGGDDPPSRPTLREALRELALSLLQGGREAVDRWRSK